MPSLIHWWEALRAPDVAKWQQKYRVDWDATDGRNGGPQQAVCEILMEMDILGKAKEEDRGAVALVQDLAKVYVSGRVLHRTPPNDLHRQHSSRCTSLYSRKCLNAPISQAMHVVSLLGTVLLPPTRQFRSQRSHDQSWGCPKNRAVSHCRRG